MKMKKVLILAYDFPPYNSIGAQRPHSWYKYFKEFGWLPIVITRQWDTNIENPIDYIKSPSNQNKSVEETEIGTIIRAPFIPNLRDRMLLKYGLNKYSFLRKILTLIYQLCEFKFSLLDNRKSIYRAGIQYLNQNKVDVIIATGEPFILFKYASRLSKKYDIPWIADYRDGWSQNYNLSNCLRKFYFNIEKSIIQSCNFLVTVSNEFKEQLALIHKKSVEIIYNGYFEEKFILLKSKPSKVFTITFLGTLYPYQPIELVSSAINNLFRKDYFVIKMQFIGIEFYSEQLTRIRDAFKDIPVILETTTRLPHDITLEKLSDSSLFLLPASSEFPQIYAKVFDYLALRKKIILFKSDGGTLDEIIKKTNSGIICNTVLEIEDAIITSYAEWVQYGFVKCDSNNIDSFSRREQAKKFTTLLDNCIT